MTGESTTFECGRCGTEFGLSADHTEIVRRDFVERPRPSRIDRLCGDCWETYVTEFLGRDFEDVLERYETATSQ